MLQRPRPIEFLRGLQIVWLPRLPLSLRRRIARQIVRLILALLRLRLRLGLPMTEEIRVIPAQDPALRRRAMLYRQQEEMRAILEQQAAADRMWWTSPA